MNQTESIIAPTNGKHKKPTPVFSISDFTGITKDENQVPLSAAIKILEDFDSFRITKEKHVVDAPATITFGDSKVAAPGNITPVTAESKAGKTAVINVIIAGAISQDGVVDGFDNLTVIPNRDGKAVIHMDTEQSEADQQYNLKTVLFRAGLEATPEFYHSYNIRTLGIKEYEAFTENVCKLCYEKYNGIHLLVIDGGADYITSVNDEAEANAIVSFFTKLAVVYNCPVVLVVHLNENAGKNTDTMPRGHIGRQAVRKGYCQLNITRDGDVSTMQALRARKAGTIDTPVICFQYCKIMGYHISVDPENIQTTKQNNKDMAGKIKAEKIAAKIFTGTSSCSYTDSISKIMKETGKSKPTAKRYLDDMQGWEIVRKEEGLYYLNTQGS